MIQDIHDIHIVSAPSFSENNYRPYLVIDKPKGLPSAPISDDDTNNALSKALELFPELKKVEGKKKCEYGLLHRLDTETDGLILIAASQDFYNYMMTLQAEDGFIKYYTAICNIALDNAQKTDGFPAFDKAFGKEPKEGMLIQSYFRHYGKGHSCVRPVTEASGKAALKKMGKAKLYTTKIVSIEKLSLDTCKVVCCISQGFRHQVRCHLAWAGLPVCGDSLYNFSDKKKAENLMFSASKISFEYPRGDLNSYDRKDTWT